MPLTSDSPVAQPSLAHQRRFKQNQLPSFNLHHPAQESDPHKRPYSN